MKVVILKGHLSGMGGLENHTLRLASLFASTGCEVVLLTSKPTDLECEGVEIIPLGSSGRLSFCNLLHFDKACKEYLKRHPADIVFGMERNSFETFYRAGSGVHAAYLKSRALVDPFWKQLSFSFNPLHRTILSLEKQCFTNPKLRTIFTNSNMVKQEIMQHYDTPQEKIEVVHNGAPYQEWKEAFEDSLEIKRTGPCELLFVGGGFRRKGLHFLLRGLKRLPKESYHLSVVGKDKELPLFQQMASQLNVTFHGPSTKVVSFYQNADVLVIPSTYDPFAGVTMEALAMGLFVLSSKHNGGCEVLNTLNGHVIEDLSCQDEMESSLKTALKHPKTKTSALQIRATIAQYDFSNQLDTIVRKTLSSK